MEFGIKKACNACNEKRQTAANWWNRTTKQNKIKTLAENETNKYIGIFEADAIKQVEMKENTQKEYLRRNSKLLEKKKQLQKSYQRNKYLGCTTR